MGRLEVSDWTRRDYDEAEHRVDKSAAFLKPRAQSGIISPLQDLFYNIKLKQVF